MDENVVKDIIRWDIINWSKSLDYWDKNIDLNNKNYKCLELGARQGGLSLWLALKGNSVVCSDISYLTQPHELQKAKDLHKKYNCQDRISCESIDALNIPYKNEFDIVIMKSTLGGIREFKKGPVEALVIEQIKKCLKPNGKILFIENGKGSFVHGFARNMLNGNKKSPWNYFRSSDLTILFSGFKRVSIKAVGFFGAFGRSEQQKKVLGYIDNLVEKIVPKDNRYVIIGYVEK